MNSILNSISIGQRVTDKQKNTIIKLAEKLGYSEYDYNFTKMSKISASKIINDLIKEGS